jgi:hypothetical protein
MSKATDRKAQAQQLLMDYIDDCTGFWDERLASRGELPESEAEREALGQEIAVQAARLFKTFGYRKA